MDADWGGYYIARRFFYVGDDDELYESDDDEFKPSAYRNKLVTSIVDDVSTTDNTEVEKLKVKISSEFILSLIK